MKVDDRDQVERRHVVVRLHRLGSLALEHLQHPIGDDEAADHVRGRERDRDEARRPS